MNFPYTEKTTTTMPAAEVDFVPAYARRPANQKKFKTWMVLAPIGALALIGGAAAMMVGPGANDAAPPVATTPSMAPVVDRTAPLPTTMSSPPVAASTPAPVAVTAAPARVAREATSVRQADPVFQTAPVRRAAPVERAAPASPPVETPAALAGVRPYSPATSSMNAAPTASANTPAPTPAPAPAAPAITVQPLN